MTPNPSRPRTSPYAIAWRIGAALLLIALILFSISLGQVPRWLGLYCVALSVLSAAAYWYDKRQAIAGGRRVSETSLHLLDLAGGIIGGLMAQVAWRHKTAKAEFGGMTGAIVFAHIAIILLLDFGFVRVPGQTLFG